MQQTYRRMCQMCLHMPNVISIKKQSNFIEIKLRHGCSPVNLLHIFKTPFPKNTSGGMLLKQKNLRRLRSLYKWNCFFINECTEPKAKILGDFAYITCYKRKYTKLYTQGGFLNLIVVQPDKTFLLHSRVANNLRFVSGSERRPTSTFNIFLSFYQNS